ncbi:hypothetical protein KOW79_003395 [Hemibagrus wyckioides]|uniref:Uncharacterized protein n=1 Tax=Hemibagrus wyckioides TaxID=337641 RepID=A0A9D3SS80_9TELE|nr:hypothetical protein KOW79_003395 [Hemibagrus wyckioides]
MSSREARGPSAGENAFKNLKYPQAHLYDSSSEGEVLCRTSRAVEAVHAKPLAAQRRARGPVGSRAEGRRRGRVLTSLCVSLPISHASIIERASRRSPALCAQPRAD